VVPCPADAVPCPPDVDVVPCPPDMLPLTPDVVLFAPDVPLAYVSPLASCGTLLLLMRPLDSRSALSSWCSPWRLVAPWPSDVTPGSHGTLSS
jgi:hypothetical protein